MDLKNKINTLFRALNFNNLQDFADTVTHGNLNRAKGLHSGRIKNFTASELKILLVDFEINEKWLFGNEEKIFKSNKVFPINVIDINQNIIDTLYLDTNLFNLDKNEKSYFLVKKIEQIGSKNFLLCNTYIQNINIALNKAYVILLSEKIYLVELISIENNIFTFASIYDSSKQVMYPKQSLEDILYAIVEKQIEVIYF